MAAALTPEELHWLELNDPAVYEAAKRAISYGEERALTDRYVSAELDEVLEYRNSPERDERLDWSTDRCSAPIVGSSGISFNFTDACIRHDFGYRNYKRLDVFDEKKDAVDRQFLEDMKDHCRTRSIVLRLSCYRWAYTFHYAVKYLG